MTTRVVLGGREWDHVQAHHAPKHGRYLSVPRGLQVYLSRATHGWCVVYRGDLIYRRIPSLERAIVAAIEFEAKQGTK